MKIKFCIVSALNRTSKEETEIKNIMYACNYRLYKNKKGENDVRKKEIVIGISLTIILVLLSALGVKKIMEPTEKEKQIAFLKAHEKEMTEFIRSYSSQDGKITFNWETTAVNTGIAFSQPVLIVKFDISDSSKPEYNNRGYVLRVKTDLKKLNKIRELMVLNDPIYSNIQEGIND
ncbi:hypothetical protein [Enterococcus mundtii]|uniref:hypothetical protein n=1 Tax=Enterococcus mundtii TaxID=53346 RepID=UPI000A733470|nr:hypothetical protein [Enterococcus mundtii]